MVVGCIMVVKMVEQKVFKGDSLILLTSESFNGIFLEYLYITEQSCLSFYMSDT